IAEARSPLLPESVNLPSASRLHRPHEFPRQHSRGCLRARHCLRRPAGCVRDRRAAPARDATVQVDGMVLPAHMDSVEGDGWTHPYGFAAAELPGVLRTVVAIFAARLLGGGIDPGLCFAAVRPGRTRAAGQRADDIRKAPVSERTNVLHSRL